MEDNRIVQELKNIVIELKRLNNNIEKKENKKQILNEVNIGSEGDNINKCYPLDIKSYKPYWKLTNAMDTIINKHNNSIIKISEK